jgi:N-acetylmuramoyl-L-alanine amidase
VELRRRLQALGYDTAGDPAEEFGPATRRALAHFQGSRGLESTGECDPATWSAVEESEYTLGDRLLCLRSPMMRGEDIADLQLRLGTLGFDSGRVDGIFGPMTQYAVGEFQRNAGIIYDQVCGPDTVEALHRLAGRAGSASVTSVREKVRLQRSGNELSSVRVALGAARADEPVVARLAARLVPHCASVALVDGDWSAQALAANDLDADVYLGLEHTAAESVEALFFATAGFESVGGRSLAELIVRELPPTPGRGIAVVRGMRIPILRETRAPAVLLKLGPGVDPHDDLLLTALQRALERWARGPLD